MHIILTTIFVIFAYLLASLSSAIVVCKLMGYPDPRSQGSGNPGATNVLRIGGKKAAIIVLLGDMLKGFIPVFLAHLLGLSDFSLGLVALAAVLGHMFPVFFQFEGGKGVATALGALFAISWLLGVTAVIVWLLVVAISRYVSLGSMVAMVITSLLSPWLMHSWGYLLPLLLISALIIWRHQENIAKLLSGKESKLGNNFSSKSGK